MPVENPQGIAALPPLCSQPALRAIEHGTWMLECDGIACSGKLLSKLEVLSLPEPALESCESNEKGRGPFQIEEPNPIQIHNRVS